MVELTMKERSLFARLNTPARIQDFLNTIPTNYEKRGNTLQSPRQVLKSKKAHCFEGALLAAAALWFHGEEPLLLDLRVVKAKDDGHVVALYKRAGYWGAISKTNHATLRFRDPMYPDLHSLALSYFHEYFLNTTGEKTLRSYAGPFNLAAHGPDWITTEESLMHLHAKLDAIEGVSLIPTGNAKYVRPADTLERAAGKIMQWKKSDPRT